MMKVLFKAGFDSFSGYGKDAVDIAIWMNKAGVTCVPWPKTLLPGLPRQFTRLLELDPRAPYDAVLTFSPPFDLKPWEFADLAPRAVGWTMWERTPMMPSDMEGHDWDMRRKKRWWSGGAGHEVDGAGRWDIDLLLVTCPMNVEAVAGLDPYVKTSVLPCGIDPDVWQPVKREVDGPAVFGVCGTMAPRKDVFQTLEAWRELKQEDPTFDARLELKIWGRGLHPKITEVYPDVVLHNEPWNHEQMHRWYQSLTCLVSASRGEGNNKPAMEMLATGGTVIATDWSAHQNWLLPDATYAVGGELVRSPKGFADFRSDREDLKRQIRRVNDERVEARDKGWTGATWIRDSHSWKIIVEKLIRHLAGGTT